MSDDKNDVETRWLAETYRPGVPQLTVRAIVLGMILGGVMCLSNLYVFFKTGWSMGVTITAAILAFALFQALSARAADAPAAGRPREQRPDDRRAGSPGT